MRSEFGKRLYDARKKAKRTQDQVCAFVGMAQGTYTKLETRGQGSAYTPKIAAYLAVNVDWLAYGVGEMDRGAAPPPTPSPFSPEAQKLAMWLDKITDPDLHDRTAVAALQVVMRAIDGPHLHTTQEPDAPSKKQRAAHPTR